MALFRVDYSGRGELSERQQNLNKMLNRLVRISEEYNVAILITNQVQADPGASALFAGGDKKAVGGHGQSLSVPALVGLGLPPSQTADLVYDLDNPQCSLMPLLPESTSERAEEKRE